MASISSALELATARLAGGGIETARLDAALLLSHVLGVPREMLVLNRSNQLTCNQNNVFMAHVERRANHEPVAYITGKKEFWSLDFYVTRDTLIPRPDSETLIEAALNHVTSRAGAISILDVGTGTGCLLIALLHELPGASGVGVDNNKQALQVAQRNADLHQLQGRVRFQESHWCSQLDGTFDLIISNPPYIADMDRGTLMPDVVNYEPAGALFAGADGLDAYRTLAKQVPERLNAGGLCVLEVGQHQEQEVQKLLQEAGMDLLPPARDLQGIARAVVARKHY